MSPSTARTFYTLFLWLFGRRVQSFETRTGTISRQLRCPHRVAVVTALMGNREGRFSINSVGNTTHTCVDYFAFVPYPPFSAKGWKVVLPNSSVSWGMQFDRVQKGSHAMERQKGLYEMLPFDPLALAYTNEHDGPFTQKLDEIMLPRFVKTQLMHIDVLAEYGHFLWVDASINLSGDVFARLEELLPKSTEVSFMLHPHRTTVLAEMKASIGGQQRYYELRDRRHYGFRPEWSHYMSNGFKDNIGLFWTCLFYARRSGKVARMLDHWWYLIRRWEFLDQTTLPYAMFVTEKSAGPMVRPAFRRWLCYMAIGNGSRKHSCCRRCNISEASPPPVTPRPQPGDEVVAFAPPSSSRAPKKGTALTAQAEAPARKNLVQGR